MAQWVQIDLLDAIAEAEEKQRKERLQLCPALEEYQQEYIKTMEADRKELCKHWRNATKNECGVYTIGVYGFTAGSSKKARLDLHLAKDYPMVYGNIYIQAGDYGFSSPTTGDDDLIEFNVHDDVDKIRSMIVSRIRGRVEENRNLDENEKRMLFNLAAAATQKAIDSMEGKNND